MQMIESQDMISAMLLTPIIAKIVGGAMLLAIGIAIIVIGGRRYKRRWGGE